MGLLRAVWPAAILAALLAAACGGDSGGEMPAAVVDTVHVRAMNVPATVEAIGTVEADHQATVSAEVEGRIARIVRDEGAQVSAGAAVIQIDAGPYLFALQSANANLSAAQAQLAVDERLFERYGRLLEAGAVDRQTYEDLEARVETGRSAVRQARAAVSTARWSVGKASVSAPFAGVVGKRHVQLGQSVSSGDELFDLVDPDPLRIRFRLPETIAGTIEAGDQVRFRVRSDTISARLATVDYVSPDIDPGTRTFEVTADYSNPDGGVVPGAYADVVATTDVHEGAAVVPEAAVVTEGEQNFVYAVVAGPKASKRAVELGSRMDGLIEILSGIRPGEVVLVAGQHGLPDGAPIQLPEAGRGAGRDTTGGSLRRE